MLILRPGCIRLSPDGTSRWVRRCPVDLLIGGAAALSKVAGRPKLVSDPLETASCQADVEH